MAEQNKAEDARMCVRASLCVCPCCSLARSPQHTSRLITRREGRSGSRRIQFRLSSGKNKGRSAPATTPHHQPPPPPPGSSSPPSSSSRPPHSALAVFSSFPSSFSTHHPTSSRALNLADVHGHIRTSLVPGGTSRAHTHRHTYSRTQARAHTYMHTPGSRHCAPRGK